nr:hypothetical protein [uncultured Helicobacter sp.]
MTKGKRTQNDNKVSLVCHTQSPCHTEPLGEVSNPTCHTERSEVSHNTESTTESKRDFSLRSK